MYLSEPCRVEVAIQDLLGLGAESWCIVAMLKNGVIQRPLPIGERRKFQTVVRKMPVKFKETLERFAQGESRKLIKCFQIFRLLSFVIKHRYEVHPTGGEIEESHHEYTCSHCTRQFNINI